MYVGAPAVIGANGVEKVLEIDLSAEERAMFTKSVGAVQTLIDACKKIAPQLA
jgi:malate dehydrogenase